MPLLVRCPMCADSRDFMCMYFTDTPLMCSVVLRSSNATFYYCMFVLLCLILLSQQFCSKPWIIELNFRGSIWLCENSYMWKYFCLHKMKECLFLNFIILERNYLTKYFPRWYRPQLFHCKDFYMYSLNILRACVVDYFAGSYWRWSPVV